MTNIPFFQSFKLTKPTNTFHLSRKVGEGELSIFLKHQDGDIIKVFKFESFSGNEVTLPETIDPETIEHRYWRECVGDFLLPIGKLIRENILVEVFYKP